MLVQKLDVKDLQFENLRTFDGTMAYAQTKRQQVVMTEQYARKWPNIHFSCMHPGWADTPGKMKSFVLWEETGRYIDIVVIFALVICLIQSYIVCDIHL